MQKIFLTGATGTVGRRVVEALTQRDDVALTPAGRHSTPSFDYHRPETYSAADGHDAVFLLIPPMDVNAHVPVIRFIDHLAAGTKPRIVYLSAYGMEDLTELPFHREVEHHLKASGLAWTILRPGFFASNFSVYERENIEQRGMIFNPAGAGKTPFIDPSDIGRAAAVALTETGHECKTYTLTGPTPYTMHEVAEILSNHLNKSIVYPEPEPDAYREALRAAGVPDMVANYMIPVYGLVKDGKVAETTDDVEQLTGRQPTDLPEVIARDF